MRRLSLILLPLFAAAMSLTGQEPVIRLDVNLVQVDAVVTNSRNKHVGNLTANDFEILQDGKPQTITNFSYVAPSAPPATSGGPATANAPQVGRAPLKTGDVRRMVALLVDDLALSSDGVANVRAALHKFASRELQPGDMVAVIRTSSGMGALQQFTTDRAVLNAAIDQIKWTWGSLSLSSLAGPPESRRPDSSAQFLKDNLVPGTLATLGYVIGGLRDMPGRKSIVLFSENVPLPEAALRGLTDSANRASVVINTIDPRGMQVSLGHREAQAELEAETAASQVGLEALAHATGGLFEKNNNFTDDALNEVVADMEGYYLIGYHPDSATFDSNTGAPIYDKTGAPLYRKVQVRLKVGGLSVRTRGGFLALPDTAGDTPLTGGAALRHALNSPFAAGDVRVQLTTLFNQTPDKQSNLSALLHIDAHDLSFTAQPDGSRHASFEVVAETYGADGVHADHSDRVFAMNLKPDQYEAALAGGVVYVVNQPIRTPGMYQMRVALRDQSSDRIGAANQFIEVPDLSKGRLTLSSVLLRQDVHGADAGMNHAEGQVFENDPATAAALRIFKPGAALSYEYLVFNTQSGPARKADLEVQTRLYRDGKLVYEGKPMVPSLTGEVTSGRVLAGGHMTLANGISPGDYLLQVVVTDKLAKQKFQSTSQTTDFIVQ